MKFRDFFESTTLDERQAIGVLSLMIGKYPLEMWAPDFQVSINNQQVLNHAWYSLRKNKIQTSPDKAPALLQQAIEVAKPIIYPQENQLEISYDHSALYDFQGKQPDPGTTMMCQVLRKGIYAVPAGERMFAIKRAVVKPL